MPTKIYSEHELAIALGLSYWTVRELRLQNAMPHFRTAHRIFYRLETVLKWLDEQEKMSQQDTDGIRRIR